MKRLRAGKPAPVVLPMASAASSLMGWTAFTIGGDLEVRRLGFGAMRITGRASGARPRTRRGRCASSGAWSSWGST